MVQYNDGMKIHSWDTHFVLERGLTTMATIRQIREEYYIPRKELADLSGVSESTLIRIEDPAHKSRIDIVKKVLQALSDKVGQELTIQNVDGINLYNPMRDRKNRGSEIKSDPAA